MTQKAGSDLGRRLQEMAMEKEIEEHKQFYKRYLLGLRNRHQLLRELGPLAVKFYEKQLVVPLILDKEVVKIKAEAKALLGKYFPPDIVALYDKQLPGTKLASGQSVHDSFLTQLLVALRDSIVEVGEKLKQDWEYKRNFIIFLNNSLYYYGLHPSILKRDPETYKRFNLKVTHYYRSRKPQVVTRHLLTYQEFADQFVRLYLDKKPIKFKGLLLPFAKIHEVKITTTLLKEDEVPLLGARYGFNWTEEQQEVEKFIDCCKDETDIYHPNPYDVDRYSKELDTVSIAEMSGLLRPYPGVAKLYDQALAKFRRDVYERHVLDDLRLALELLLKEVLGNSKSLENQLPELGKLQKKKGISSEITNTFSTLLKYYASYQNNYVKHNDDVKVNEIEFIFNFTTVLMRFILK